MIDKCPVYGGVLIEDKCPGYGGVLIEKFHCICEYNNIITELLNIFYKASSTAISLQYEKR